MHEPDKYYEDGIAHPLGKSIRSICAFRFNPVTKNREVWNPWYDRWQFSSKLDQISYDYDKVPVLSYEDTWAEYYNDSYGL